MDKQYRYQLESRRLTGHQPRKLTCQHCGKKKCFVRYVDTRNGLRYVADNVGKCDHQQSCGYRYKPADYYHDNLWAREPAESHREYCQPVQLPPFQPIPPEYVSRSLSTPYTKLRVCNRQSGSLQPANSHFPTGKLHAKWAFARKKEFIPISEQDFSQLVNRISPN